MEIKFRPLSQIPPHEWLCANEASLEYRHDGVVLLRVPKSPVETVPYFKDEATRDAYRIELIRKAEAESIKEAVKVEYEAGTKKLSFLERLTGRKKKPE